MKTGTAPTFLIVALRYLGDVLLSTPIALSIKEQMPDAHVDYLVFAGTEGILSKNPYVRAVHTVPPGSKSFALLASFWKKYDYAIGINASDRTTIAASLAGRRSTGFWNRQCKEWWKPLLLDVCNTWDDHLHNVPLMLRQVAHLGISIRPRVVVNYDATDIDFVRRHLGEGGHVLLHPYTRQPNKLWRADAWVELAHMISEAGLVPVFSTTPSPADMVIKDAIARHAPPGSRFFPEAFTIPQLAAAISLASCYVGVDTVATHMAVALDIPTVALYGSTLLRHWGPWPNECRETAPYGDGGGIQRCGRITVIQKDWPCVPCNRLSCGLRSDGKAECLDKIEPEEVFRELVLLLRG